MGKKYRQLQSQFASIDKAYKQSDLAPSASILTNTPFPFSSVGALHPFFAKTSDLRGAISAARSNVAQVEMYLKSQCDESPKSWCAVVLGSFEVEMREV